MPKKVPNYPFRVKISLEKGSFMTHILAIKPDIETSVGRSRTWVEEDESSFYVYIGSPDTVALRAAIGSITRWFKVVNDVLEVLG